MHIGGKGWEKKTGGLSEKRLRAVRRRARNGGFRLVRPLKYLFFLVLAHALASGQARPTFSWPALAAAMAAVAVHGGTSAFATLGVVPDGLASAAVGPSAERASTPLAAVLADAATLPAAGAPAAARTATAPASAFETRTWDFDQDRPGRTPRGWSSVTGHWGVIPDPTAPTLPNTFGLSPGRFFTSLVRLSNYYPLAVAVDPPQYRDFVLEAWFKTVGGRLNCSGGLVFGYQNPKDYYVMEAGCPSDYFSVARAGRERYEVLGQTVVAIALERWYKLRLDAVGPRVTCYVDGRVVLRVNAGRLRPGRVGLWARADAQARFDNVTVGPLK